MRVLFLCVHNSARSQLAEAILRQMAGDRIQVYSAGSAPSRVHPLAKRVLEERGIDTFGLQSKSVSLFQDQQFDYVITLCAEEVCPVFPGEHRRLYWTMPDPSAVEGTDDQKLDAFRKTADELQKRIAGFLAALHETTAQQEQ